MATVAATPSQLLARQRETLSELRAAAETDTTQLVDVLRAELASRQEENRTLSANVKAAERKEAAAVAEAVSLRTQLAHAQTETTAASRRMLWDHRKREEVAAAAAASERCASAGGHRSTATLLRVTSTGSPNVKPVARSTCAVASKSGRRTSMRRGSPPQHAALSRHTSSDHSSPHVSCDDKALSRLSSDIAVVQRVATTRWMPGLRLSVVLDARLAR